MREFFFMMLAFTASACGPPSAQTAESILGVEGTFLDRVPRSTVAEFTSMRERAGTFAYTSIARLTADPAATAPERAIIFVYRLEARCEELDYRFISETWMRRNGEVFTTRVLKQPYIRSGELLSVAHDLCAGRTPRGQRFASLQDYVDGAGERFPSSKVYSGPLITASE